MPEVSEVMYMVLETKEKLHNLKIEEVVLVGHEFKKPAKHLKWRNLIASIPVPFSILDIKSRGKEICLLTSQTSMRILLGQGSFLYFLKPEESIFLEQEPFFTDCFLVFRGKQGIFCLVDCHTFHHQIKIALFTGSVPQWRTGFGPCVLSQHNEFRSNFKVEMENNPEYFRTHSLVAIMYNEKLFNGLAS